MATEQTIAKADLARIEREYTIPRPDEVRELLARYPHVIPALLEVPTRMKQVFGGRLRGVVLEAVPDYDEGEDMFSALALVKATAEEALDLRRDVDRWWNERSSEVRLMVALGVVPV
jgi:hypothetical protein